MPEREHFNKIKDKIVISHEKKKPVGDFENISVLTNFLQVWIVYFVTDLNKTDFMGKILVDRDFLKSRHLEVKVPIVVAVELFYACRSKMFLAIFSNIDKAKIRDHTVTFVHF